ncbi:MAG: Maf family protein [Fervidicoccaceae archaeon]
MSIYIDRFSKNFSMKTSIRKSEGECTVVIVLASKSRRRIELLKQLGLDFIVIEPNIEEEIRRGDPRATVLINASKKAEAVRPISPDGSVIVGIDTVVVIDGEILGKPPSLNSNIEMLRRLNGRWHTVVSGVHVSRKDRSLVEEYTVETRVKFGSFSEREILAYASSLEGLDKAGGYAAQGLGAVLIEKIEGDFYNVVGLPIFSLMKTLERFGYDIFSSGLRKRI